MFEGLTVKVIIPALNEAKSIALVLEEIPDWVDEVIVADNASTDATAEVAKRCQATVVHEPRRGYGQACLAGMAAIDSCDVVVFLDADHSDYPQEMAKLLEPIAKATRRKRNPLRGKKDIALRAGKVINKYKVGKHFKLTVTYAHFNYERKEEQIKAEAALDGFYVVRTSVPAELISPENVVSTYKRLSVVERALRCLKTVDLKVRPIFHRLEKRVRAHIFLCVLAYYVEWEMRRLLAPMLFDDEDHESGEQRRRSVVATAQRSAKAERKASSKHTVDGIPVHSFRTMLQDLGTIACNQIQPRIPGSPTFPKITVPTATQRKALDLLGVKL